MRKDVFNFYITKNLKNVGVFNMPVVHHFDARLLSSEFLIATQFNFAMTEKQPGVKICHFYLDDYQFERIWQKPDLYIPILKKFNAVIGPDFSMYMNMPKAQQIYNNWRNKVLMAYWQQCGVKVIPNIQWSDKESFKWCFEGIEPGGVVAISTIGCHTIQGQINFMRGFNKMLEVLQPSKILCVGTLNKELVENEKVLKIDSYMEIRRKLWAEEGVRFQPKK